MRFLNWLRLPLFKNGPTCLGAASIIGIARSAPGIHAARPQTPFQTLISRNGHLNYTELQKLTNIDRKLMRIRCMRTTLHIVPVEQAAVLHYSTLQQRLAKCRHRAKHIPDYYDNGEVAEDWIRDRLENMGSIEESRDENAFCLATNISRQTFRLKLKELWELGEVCFQDLSRQWNKEKRVFIDTDKAYGGALFPHHGHESFGYQVELGKLYFEAFGPATLTDFSWWSGLPKKVCMHVVEVLQQSNLAACRHHNLILYFYPHTLDTTTEYRDDDSIYFMPWEDYSLKAYFETRFRYGSREILQRAFNSIGEVRRTIVSRGEIIGIWDVDSSGIPTHTELFENSLFNTRQVTDAMEAVRCAIERNTFQGFLLGADL